jgi:glycosyltransferase involved in cell wall biosynthesis
MNEKKSSVEVSIVIPLFNERDNLEPLLARLEEIMSQLNRRYEIIFVDDGSTDGSFQVLERLYAEHDVVKAVQFRKNHGKSAALAVGFQQASGEIIITMDADMQDDPAEISNLLEKLEEGEGYDLVSGWKFKRQDPLSKTLPSRLFNRVTSLISGIKIHDFNCGLKAYRREVTDTISVYGELHRYLPVLAYWKGFRIGEIKVRHHPRLHGRSKFGGGRFIKGFLDLLTVTFLTKFTRRPMHLFGVLGLVLFLAGLVANLHLTWLWLHDVGIGHRPLLFLGILLVIVGIQFLLMGFIGEMITSQHQNQDKDKGDYLIKKRLS